MAREIKFRAWDNVKNKMLHIGEEPDVVFGFDSNSIIATDITEDEEEFKSLHHLQYMEYTGLKDKNGKEIYEGDIIDAEDEGFPFTKSWKGVVKMIDGSWLIENFEGTDGEYLFEELRADEVVGNIYENPDFLMGGKDNE